ncbi:O-antigen ligase family protein [Amphibacillus xylanus]|uniref:Putative glycosyltransferase n=1 Tax=Amphibacillus xylanus (strain ATCC 51415 / DSM 6626 / JCM 7361 / LMG 17667 / NBRC 15112 / Ep01) TaxID=698758 RepID=K0J022_AMPXN|nr:O-antigen ligase family protein [Amphibacillus xylanus]BAM48165.1 putative glycosyltransferase [Amphibacillus xylanus NBRC 15112]
MQNKYKNSDIIWITFLLLQPFIDMIALYSNRLPSLIRGGFLLFAIIYLFSQKKARLYILLICLYGCIHLAVLVLQKAPLSLSSEISYFIKTIYLPIVFLYAKNKFRTTNYVNMILINQVVINLVMIIAGLTQTGKRTYDMLAKQGHTGWFFSGNELSVILLMGLAMILLKLITTKNNKHTFWLFALLLVHISNMLTVGTKVSLFSIFILVSITTLLTFIKPANLKLSAALLTLFLIIYFVYPYTPAGHNTQRLVNEPSTSEDINQDPDQVFDQMLSGRRDFLMTNIKQYQTAPLTMKAFGLGYGGLYKEQPKLVEMDVFDWFIGFGFLGMMLLCYPFIVLIVNIIPNLHWRYCKASTILLLAIFLSAGSAFIAGHVLSAPAVSIYLTLLLVIFNQRYQDEKKLLIITTMYPTNKTPSFGIFIKNHVEKIKNYPIKVDILAIKNHKMDKLNVIVKYTVWLIRFCLILLFKAESYQVVHAHYVFPSGLLGQVIKRIYGTRLIVTAHGGDIDKMPKKHRLIAVSIKRILTNADHIVVVGEKLKQVLNKKYKIAHNKLTVLNMGVNRSVFKPGSKTHARKKLNLPQDKIIVLFVGNLIKAKGLEELVKACESLTDQHHLECHLIGANKEPIFFEQLLKSTKMKIHHHKATVQTQIATWLQAADIFVLPSHMEGFGLAALEAMATHTPVVGTDVGGLAYLLADEAGLIVPPHQPQALGDAINKLIQDQALRERLIKNGEEKANQYDQDKVIAKLIQLYGYKELVK